MSKSTDQHRAELLVRFETMDEKQQAFHMIVALRFLEILLNQEHAKTLVNGGLYLPLPGSVEVA